MEDLRIGVLEGEPAYMFGNVSDLAVGRDLSLYILDGTGIRQYDRQGRFVRQIGGRGQGPGEYGSIQGIEVLPDGRLAIWDIGHRRIIVYSAEGADPESWFYGISAARVV